MNRFYGFLLRSLRTLPVLCVTLGPVFLAIGFWMQLDAWQFQRRAEPAQLTVLSVEHKWHDGQRVFRPHLGLDEPGKRRLTYVGATWWSHLPFRTGEVAPGWVDRDSGQMRLAYTLASNSALGRNTAKTGGGLFLFGLLIFLWRRFRTR